MPKSPSLVAGSTTKERESVPAFPVSCKDEVFKDAAALSASFLCTT